MRLPFSNEWKKTDGAQMLKQCRRKKRAAWLWDSEGNELLWRNQAALLFLANVKHGQLKLSKPATPIPGQVKRLLRLGSVALSSLARVRFLIGTKPYSATCSCTPIELENDQMGLLIVAVDPVETKLVREFKKLRRAKKSDRATSKNIAGKKKKSKQKGQLSKLVDQLSTSANLFEPVKFDTEIDPTVLKHVPQADPNVSLQPDDIQQWRIVGSEFTPFEPSPLETIDPVKKPASLVTPDQRPASGEEIEKLAKYNFEELSRILEDKVGEPAVEQNETVAEHIVSTPTKTLAGNTVKMSEEVLVLNRLPVGILIFKDQEILFANRAMADLVGSDSISKLKSDGLAAIFPRVEDHDSPLGPVLSIVGASGEPIDVSARLQGITWREGPALMLSAQPKQVDAFPAVQDAKGLVKAVCDARDNGYIETDKDGNISFASARAIDILAANQNSVLASPLKNFVALKHHEKFNGFMEQPAKTAHTQMPFIELESADGKNGLEMFTEGNAGIVRGYFGTVFPLDVESKAAYAPANQGEVATLLLARISRDLRRPLNTIMGFSELISTQAFGQISNERYIEYARDIHNSGNQISHLTEELDEYARLRDEEYIPDASSFDLVQLLDECMHLVRDEANRAQVFIRSAISEGLPNIMADRSSLRQAMLNMLASAIAQTPPGAKVVLSAQYEDDGGVGVHVRDSSSGPTGIDDRFVVFREQDETGQQAMVSMTSSMGLALTRSLVSVNSCALHMDPSAGLGTLMSLVIPRDLLESN